MALGEAEWMAFFNTPAGTHAFGRVLGDVYDQIKTDEEKAAGVRTMGRRPGRKPVSLTEVYATIFPPMHSMEPFPLAFAKLLNGRSQRAFAAKIPINQSALSRFLSGERKPDLTMLERIAEAAKVQPGYFMEYRAAYLGKLVERVMLAHPNVSIGAHRQVQHFRKQFEAAS